MSPLTTTSRCRHRLVGRSLPLTIVLGAALLGFTACDHAYFPLQAGEYETRGVTIDDGPFVLEVIALRPGAVTTVSPGQTVSLGFTIECKADKTIQWGLYFARDDGEISMIQILGCPSTGRPTPFALNWTIPKGSGEYVFGHGHTVGIRVAAAATYDALVNGGPYLYFGNRDLMTWKMLD